ncbi:hypothetical protein HKK72_22815 [Actinomadura sp. HBU206391]|nr:hypothetical protein [Actinomadura sp. HBU206391]
MVKTMAEALMSAEDGAGWPAFVRDLVARGLSGVQIGSTGLHRFPA